MKRFSYNYQFFKKWMTDNNRQINEVLGPMNTTSYQSVNRWMDGEMPMKIDAMLGFCNHFDISPISFFLEDGKPIFSAHYTAPSEKETDLTSCKNPLTIRQTVYNRCSSVGELLNASLNTLKSNQNIVNGTTGIPTGFGKIDEIISGFQNGNLVTIASRPAMGKTSLALSLIKNIAIDLEIPTLLFSIESNSSSILNRIISCSCGVPTYKMQNSSRIQNCEWETIDNNIAMIKKAPLYIDDSARVTICDLREIANRCVAEHGVRLIFIDYFQLIYTQKRSNRSRHDELAELMNELKILARELNIPIILLSQLNRALEDRDGFDGKRPKLSDLRECGVIEEASDIVLFVHRPEYYHIYQDDMGYDLHGMAQIIIAKNKMGHIGDVLLTFDGDCSRFGNP